MNGILTSRADSPAGCVERSATAASVSSGADIARCGFTFPAAARSRDAAGDAARNSSGIEPSLDRESFPGDRAAHRGDQQLDAVSDGLNDATRSDRGTAGSTHRRIV